MTDHQVLAARPQVGPRVIFFTDVHANTRTPSMRTDNYRQTVLDKLEWVLGYASQISAEPILICGGDLFDVPMVNLELADDILDLFKSISHSVGCVLGNHDLESSIATAPRTVLGHLMRRAPQTIFSLPHLGRPGFELGGMHWWAHHYRYDNHLDRLHVPLSSSDAPRIIASHAYFLKHKPPFDGYTLFDDVDTNAHLILLGHYHPTQELTKLKNPYDTRIGGPGALLRGALSRDDLTRLPSIAVVENTPEGLLVDFVPVPIARPSSEIFKIEQAQREAARTESLDRFAANLDTFVVQKLNVAEILETVAKAESVPNDVKAEALRRIGVK